MHSSKFRRQTLKSSFYSTTRELFFVRFFDKVDAASDARGDWHRDPDGYDGDASDVSL